MTLAFAVFCAGFLHVLSGPDHLAAIAPYAVDGKARAWRTGIRWGLGHATGALAVGLLVLAVRDAFPVEAVSAWAERLVGIALLGIGIWGIRTALIRLKPGAIVGGTRVHGRAAFAVGTLHGTAGGAQLIGILPALALPSEFGAGSHLLLFGIGSVAAMSAFALVVGWISGRRVVISSRSQAALLGLSSLVAVGVGGSWIFAST